MSRFIFAASIAAMRVPSARESAVAPLKTTMQHSVVLISAKSNETAQNWGIKTAVEMWPKDSWSQHSVQVLKISPAPPGTREGVFIEEAE